jgi:DNA-directed RNA polymerase subunit RPC12/RpoP
MNEYKCPKCNSTNLFTQKKDTQTGLYCKDCGRWIKWLNKEEARVFETDTNDDSKWINVKDRLPDNDNRVLVYMHENRMSYTRIDTDRLVKGRWVRWETCVTHWMPLPEAPKEGE